jgi:hypothetical protein
MSQQRGPQQPEPQSFADNTRQWINGTIGLSQCVAKVPEAILRKPPTVGKKYFSSIQPVIGLFAGFFYVAWWHSVHAVCFFWIALAAFAYQRIGGLWRDRNLYSQDRGQSIVCKDNFAAQGCWEPALTLAAGVAMCLISPGAGTFLMLSAVALALSENSTKLEMDAQSQAITDAKALQMGVQEHYYRSQAPASSRGRFRPSPLLFAAVIALAAWAAMTGRIRVPAELSTSVAGLFSRPLTEEEKERLRQEQDFRRMQEQARAEEEREEAQRRAWRRWNAGY